MKHSIYIVVFLISACLKLQAASDTLITLNNDRLIGELKTLDGNIATFSTNYSNKDFSIKWNQVRYISTNHAFRVNTQSGIQIFGRFQGTDGDSLNVWILGEKDSLRLPYAQIVAVSEIQKRFIDKIELGFGMGYTLTKSNNTSQLNLRANAAYNARYWRHTGTYDSYANIVDTIVTGRGTSSLGTELSLPRNWVVMAQLSRFYSDELRLENRIVGLSGIGNYILRRRNVNWLLLGGVAYNNEKFFELPDKFESGEYFLASDFRLRVEDKLTLGSSAAVFPSITEQGRTRTNFGIDLTWDLTKRFKLTNSYTLNHDSRPPAGANSTDYVFSLTFGWEL